MQMNITNLPSALLAEEKMKVNPEDMQAEDMRAHAASGFWLELNCRDAREAMLFYGGMLGWRFDEIGLADGSAYRIARHAGRPVCGIHEIDAERDGDIPDHWASYARVADMAAALRAARMAGGEVLQAPFRVPGLGQLALLADPHGALFGIIEFQPEMADAPQPREAALSQTLPG